MELVGVHGELHIEVRVPPGQEGIGEAVQVVHHVEVRRGRFAWMSEGEFFPLYPASLVRFESADAEERMRRNVLCCLCPLPFLVEDRVVVPEE